MKMEEKYKAQRLCRFATRHKKVDAVEGRQTEIFLQSSCTLW